MSKTSREAHGWAARNSSGVLSPFSFARREVGDYDVSIKILYCGICHSDLHAVKDEVGMSVFPIVPGHEIVGEVVQVGSRVLSFGPGDMAGVSCFVDSCGHCDDCERNLECFCRGAVMTYCSTDRDGSTTYGGFSDHIVVDERFVLRIPDSLPLHSAAPLLCAGITVYSAMRYFGLDRPGLRLGVVGLGGLGHVAVRFAKALGVTVSVISTSPRKEKEAIELIGADSFILSTNEEQMKMENGSMDGIIDTVSAAHPVAPLIHLLKTDGKLVLVGPSKEPMEMPPISLIMGRKLVAGSRPGGMKETQEMLDFAAEHGITAEVEIIAMNYVNAALERLARGDVRYRFVIDVANTLKAS
ncbi:hypothetical protein HPP92_012082 [Vanilla planifolia]|uniref:cinnamyl-alcohol dehydrogenase n=1 Tax=Vanilla planifolia TaxID=51239 RepID=A0A835V442_VANPL|nr:hypothetical protein HPP92_012082 [Vanilla planifolia]